MNLACRYLNPQGKGLLLAEARHGSLQDYLDSNHAALSWTQRWTICEEICEAIVHIHGKDVVHSHLRPENILVHAVDGSNTHIWLTDFGGSTCPSLGLDGGHLPDTPFFDPRSEWKSTPATDIFSLGSIFYIVLTGHWPFLDGPLDPKDRVSYEEMVEQSFYNGLFPHDLDCEDEKVVMGCWQHKLETAEQVSEAVRDLRGLKYSGVTA